ncbi:MAG: hypothetical protein IT196_24285 [Acidimicrobiales bacterium]|nr:hypothetical protein [Acidimicrobiales bacterium]
MIEPPWFLSLLLVLLAARPRPARPAGCDTGLDNGRDAAIAAAVVGAALVAVTLAADALAELMAVTAPSIRLAAALAVGVLAIGRLIASARPAGTPAANGHGDEHGSVSGHGRRWATRLGSGPLRVEVAAALWALAVDHGTTLALLGVAGVVALDLADLADPTRPGDASPRHARRTAPAAIGAGALGVAWTTGALVVAVLVGIDGILGL